MSQTPAPYGGGYVQTTVTEPRIGGAHIAIAWVATILSGGYMLPWAIAATRQKSNTATIGLLTFFLGWTIIGWVVALVMSCTAEPTRVTTVTYGPAPGAVPVGWYSDGSGDERYWDGVQWSEQTR